MHHLNQGQPFLLNDLPRLGLTRHRLRLLIREHEVYRVFSGCYVDASVGDSHLTRVKSLHLVMPAAAVLTGSTAAWLYGVDLLSPDDRFGLRPTCLIPHGTSRCRARYVKCVQGMLPAADITEIDGLRVTTPVRTASDLLRRNYRPLALAAADALAHAGLVSPLHIHDYVHQLVHFPGVVQARELAGLIDAKAESGGESCQRLRLIDAGLPAPACQVDVYDVNGRFVARLDHAYVPLRIGVEFNGKAFHSHPDDQARDAVRLAYLRENLHWRVSVAEHEDIWGEDASFEEEIAGWLGRTVLPRSW